MSFLHFLMMIFKHKQEGNDINVTVIQDMNSDYYTVKCREFPIEFSGLAKSREEILKRLEYEIGAYYYKLINNRIDP